MHICHLFDLTAYFVQSWQEIKERDGGFSDAPPTGAAAEDDEAPGGMQNAFI